jgi:hypothetical protein
VLSRARTGSRHVSPAKLLRIRLGERLRIASMAVLLALALGCGGASPTAPSPSPHGEVNDAVGDAIPRPSQFTSPPDLVRATVDVVAGNISFMIRLAPGTFDALTTVLNIDLDTDQNLSTGDGRGGLGVDYGITYGPAGFVNPPLGNNEAYVFRFAGPTPPFFVIAGRVSIMALADGINVSVPLSLLGNDDGRLNFRIQSLVQLTTISATPFDDMPDVASSPGTVK